MIQNFRYTTEGMAHRTRAMWITILLCLIQAIGIGGKCTAELNSFVPYEEGSEVVLTCSIVRCVNYTGSIPHQVTWSKGGSDITRGVTSEEIKNNGTQSNLTITVVKSDNNQVVQCSSPAASPVSNRLNITYTPVIRIIKSSPYTVREDYKVNVDCVTEESNPPATSYQWIFKESVRSTSYRLTFSATRADSGVYTCSVRNSVGTSTRNIMINVTYKPSSVSLSPNTAAYDLTELIDEMPPVSCSADCNPPCTYTWDSTRQPVLDLGLARRGDAGIHRCSANNEVGRASASINVRVKYPPDIEFGGKQVVLEGERIDLTCEVRGVPANYTYYEWYQESPVDGRRVQSGNVSSNGLVHLPTLSYMHNGIYHCSVSNGVPNPDGQTTITGTILKLRVNGPFHNLQSLYTQTGYPGSDISFFVSFFQFSRGPVTRSWYNVTSGEAVSLERGNIRLENIDYHTMFFSTNVTVEGYRIIATITNFTVWDFGSYMLHLESLEQTRVVHLRIDREMSDSNTANGWMISTIVLLLMIVGCALAAGIWTYRRGNCNKGTLLRCLEKEKDRTSDEEDNVDQNYSDNQGVDALQYDPSVYTPLQINQQPLSENPYSNLQSQSEHTYECLKTKNNSGKGSPVDAGGQSSKVDQESSSVTAEAASLYQNVNITTKRDHSNKEKHMPPKPKPKPKKHRKKQEQSRNTEAHYNGAFRESVEM